MNRPLPDTSIREQVFEQIRRLLEPDAPPVADDTPLIGDASVMDSMKLVELCLALEDLAEGAGFRFDWTSDAAMSRSRSMFRSAGALAAEYQAQMAGAR